VQELTRTYGAQHMTAPLRRVLVRPPQAADLPSWRDLGWRGEPDSAALAAEHEAFCGLLAGAGADVVVAGGNPGNLDAIYAFDPVLVTDDGALLLRPGKPQRRHEPAALVPALETAGVPVGGSLSGNELAEAATRSGSTTRRSSSAARTGRTTPGSRRCGARSRTST
jgi:N-dimethylarginine dimethylaminohydrolase